MKSKNCVLKTELMEGLLQYERDTNLSPKSIIESLVEDFLYNKGYLTIGVEDNSIPFPDELNKPLHLKYTSNFRNGKLQVRKNIEGKGICFASCDYDTAKIIIEFLERKGWDLKYSIPQTKLKGEKQVEFLLNEIKKEDFKND